VETDVNNTRTGDGSRTDGRVAGGLFSCLGKKKKRMPQKKGIGVL